MHRWIRGVWLAAAVLLVGAAVAGAREDIRKIAPDDAAAIGGWTVVDVREPHELAQDLGVIEGAHNIPLGRILLGQGLEGRLDKDARILMVCRTGVRSARAAARAAALGFTNVHSLDGGMVAWNEEGLAVTHSSTESSAKPPVTMIEMAGIPCG